MINSQLQSYDIISKVVSLAYGKFLNEKKSETATNQRITKNHLLDPMENFWHRHGKRAKKWLLLKEKSAKKQSPAAVKCPPEVRQKTFGVYYVKEETKEAKPIRL